jgi:micrococcal nuclease
MQTLKDLAKPIVLMYLLVVVVAITKLPLFAMLTPALTETALQKYNYQIESITLEKAEYGLVTDVSDGDTIAIDETIKVRLLGIDTPELEHKNINIRLECHAKEAHTRMRQLILGKYVYLIRDARDKDKYGRKLRHIFLPIGSDTKRFLYINAYMVGEGYARAYILEPKLQYKDNIESLQIEAKSNRKGLWGVCDREKYRW